MTQFKKKYINHGCNKNVSSVSECTSITHNRPNNDEYIEYDAEDNISEKLKTPEFETKDLNGKKIHIKIHKNANSNCSSSTKSKKRNKSIINNVVSKVKDIYTNGFINKNDNKLLHDRNSLIMPNEYLNVEPTNSVLYRRRTPNETLHKSDFNKINLKPFVRFKSARSLRDQMKNKAIIKISNMNPSQRYELNNTRPNYLYSNLNKTNCINGNYMNLEKHKNNSYMCNDMNHLSNGTINNKFVCNNKYGAYYRRNTMDDPIYRKTAKDIKHNESRLNSCNFNNLHDMKNKCSLNKKRNTICLRINNIKGSKEQHLDEISHGMSNDNNMSFRYDNEINFKSTTTDKSDNTNHTKKLKAIVAVPSSNYNSNIDRDGENSYNQSSNHSNFITMKSYSNEKTCDYEYNNMNDSSHNQYRNNSLSLSKKNSSFIKNENNVSRNYDNLMGNNLDLQYKYFDHNGLSYISGKENIRSKSRLTENEKLSSERSSRKSNLSTKGDQYANSSVYGKEKESINQSRTTNLRNSHSRYSKKLMNDNYNKYSSYEKSKSNDSKYHLNSNETNLENSKREESIMDDNCKLSESIYGINSDRYKSFKFSKKNIRNSYELKQEIPNEVAHNKYESFQSAKKQGKSRANTYNFEHEDKKSNEKVDYASKRSIKTKSSVKSRLNNENETNDELISVSERYPIGVVESVGDVDDVSDGNEDIDDDGNYSNKEKERRSLYKQSNSKHNTSSKLKKDYSKRSNGENPYNSKEIKDENSYSSSESNYDTFEKNDDIVSNHNSMPSSNPYEKKYSRKKNSSSARELNNSDSNYKNLSKNSLNKNSTHFSKIRKSNTEDITQCLETNDQRNSRISDNHMKKSNYLNISKGTNSKIQSGKRQTSKYSKEYRTGSNRSFNKSQHSSFLDMKTEKQKSAIKSKQSLIADNKYENFEHSHYSQNEYQRQKSKMSKNDDRKLSCEHESQNNSDSNSNLEVLPKDSKIVKKLSSHDSHRKYRKNTIKESRSFEENSNIEKLRSRSSKNNYGKNCYTKNLNYNEYEVREHALVESDNESHTRKNDKHEQGGSSLKYKNASGYDLSKSNNNNIENDNYNYKFLSDDKNQLCDEESLYEHKQYAKLNSKKSKIKTIVDSSSSYKALETGNKKYSENVCKQRNSSHKNIIYSNGNQSRVNSKEIQNFDHDASNFSKKSSRIDRRSSYKLKMPTVIKTENDNTTQESLYNSVHRRDNDKKIINHTSKSKEYFYDTINDDLKNPTLEKIGSSDNIIKSYSFNDSNSRLNLKGASIAKFYVNDNNSSKSKNNTRYNHKSNSVSSYKNSSKSYSYINQNDSNRKGDGNFSRENTKMRHLYALERDYTNHKSIKSREDVTNNGYNHINNDENVFTNETLGKGLTNNHASVINKKSLNSGASHLYRDEYIYNGNNDYEKLKNKENGIDDVSYGNKSFDIHNSYQEISHIKRPSKSSNHYMIETQSEIYNTSNEYKHIPNKNKNNSTNREYSHLRTINQSLTSFNGERSTSEAIKKNCSKNEEEYYTNGTKKSLYGDNRKVSSNSMFNTHNDSLREQTTFNSRGNKHSVNSSNKNNMIDPMHKYENKYMDVNNFQNNCRVIPTNGFYLKNSIKSRGYEKDMDAKEIEKVSPVSNNNTIANDLGYTKEYCNYPNTTNEIYADEYQGKQKMKYVTEPEYINYQEKSGKQRNFVHNGIKSGKKNSQISGNATEFNRNNKSMNVTPHKNFEYESSKKNGFNRPISKYGTQHSLNQIITNENSLKYSKDRIDKQSRSYNKFYDKRSFKTENDREEDKGELNYANKSRASRKTYEDEHASKMNEVLSQRIDTNAKNENDREENNSFSNNYNGASHIKSGYYNSNNGSYIHHNNSNDVANRQSEVFYNNVQDVNMSKRIESDPFRVDKNFSIKNNMQKNNYPQSQQYASNQKLNRSYSTSIIDKDKYNTNKQKDNDSILSKKKSKYNEEINSKSFFGKRNLNQKCKKKIDVIESESDESSFLKSESERNYNIFYVEKISNNKDVDNLLPQIMNMGKMKRCKSYNTYKNDKSKLSSHETNRCSKNKYEDNSTDKNDDIHEKEYTSYMENASSDRNNEDKQNALNNNYDSDKMENLEIQKITNRSTSKRTSLNNINKISDCSGYSSGISKKNNESNTYGPNLSNKSIQNSENYINQDNEQIGNSFDLHEKATTYQSIQNSSEESFNSLNKSKKDFISKTTISKIMSNEHSIHSYSNTDNEEELVKNSSIGYKLLTNKKGTSYEQSLNGNSNFDSMRSSSNKKKSGSGLTKPVVKEAAYINTFTNKLSNSNTDDIGKSKVMSHQKSTSMKHVNENNTGSFPSDMNLINNKSTIKLSESKFLEMKNLSDENIKKSNIINTEHSNVDNMNNVGSNSSLDQSPFNGIVGLNNANEYMKKQLDYYLKNDHETNKNSNTSSHEIESNDNIKKIDDANNNSVENLVYPSTTHNRINDLNDDKENRNFLCEGSKTSTINVTQIPGAISNNQVLNKSHSSLNKEENVYSMSNSNNNSAENVNFNNNIVCVSTIPNSTTYVNTDAVHNIPPQNTSVNIASNNSVPIKSNAPISDNGHCDASYLNNILGSSINLNGGGNVIKYIHPSQEKKNDLGNTDLRILKNDQVNKNYNIPTYNNLAQNGAIDNSHLINKTPSNYNLANKNISSGNMLNHNSFVQSASSSSLNDQRVTNNILAHNSLENNSNPKGMHYYNKSFSMSDLNKRNIMSALASQGLTNNYVNNTLSNQNIKYASNPNIGAINSICNYPNTFDQNLNKNYYVGNNINNKNAVNYSIGNLSNNQLPINNVSSKSLCYNANGKTPVFNNNIMNSQNANYQVMGNQNMGNYALKNHSLSNNSLSNNSLSNYSLSNHSLSNHNLSNHNLSNHAMNKHSMSTPNLINNMNNYVLLNNIPMNNAY